MYQFPMGKVKVVNPGRAAYYKQVSIPYRKGKAENGPGACRGAKRINSLWER